MDTLMDNIEENFYFENNLTREDYEVWLMDNPDSNFLDFVEEIECTRDCILEQIKIKEVL